MRANEPHEFQIALRLALQPAAGWDAIEVSRRGIRRAGRRLPAQRPRTESHKVERLDEGLDNTHRVVFADKVIHALGQQRDFMPSLPSMNHFMSTCRQRVDSIEASIKELSHSLAAKQHAASARQSVVATARASSVEPASC